MQPVFRSDDLSLSRASPGRHGASFRQQACNLNMAVLIGKVKRCAAFVAQVDVSSSLQQQSHNLDMALNRCSHDGRAVIQMTAHPCQHQPPTATATSQGGVALRRPMHY